MHPLANHLEAPRYAAFLLRIWQSPGSDTIRIVVEQASQPGTLGFDSWSACELYLLTSIRSRSSHTPALSTSMAVREDAELGEPRS